MSHPAEQAFFDYNITQSAAITENNAVGPSADIVLRPNASLPNTLSAGGADPNTIYLDAVNGDDADSGATFALAVKTFGIALAQITVTRTTIHIATSGGHSELSEAIVAASAINSNTLNIQVEAGNTARLTLTGSGGYYVRGVAATLFSINGLEIIGAPDSIEPPIGVDSTARKVSVEWCRITAPLICIRIGVSGVANNSIFRVSGANGIAAVTGISSPGLDPAFTNCAFISEGPQTTAIEYTIVALFTEASITNCAFSYFETAITTDGGAATLTVQPSLCIFDGCGTLQNDISTPGVVLEITKSLINVTSNGNADVSSATNAFSQAPLFWDEMNENFRLAHILRSVDGVNFPRTSPAVGLGSDAGVFDVTYGAASEASQQLEIPSDASIKTVALKYTRHNFQRWQNIQGSARQTWDDVKQAIEIIFDGKWWAGTDYSLRLAVLTRYKSILRFYPEGVQGLFRVTPVPAFPHITPSGIVAALTVGSRVVDVSATIVRDMEPEAYNGWVAWYTWTPQFDTAKTGYFLIDTHDGDTITLGTQLSGSLTWPGGFVGDSDMKINIMYLPCLLDQADVKLIAEAYENRDTDAVNDVVGPMRPWYKRSNLEDSDDAPEEWHNRSIRLIQAEEKSTL